MVHLTCSARARVVPYGLSALMALALIGVTAASAPEGAESVDVIAAGSADSQDGEAIGVLADGALNQPKPAAVDAAEAGAGHPVYKLKPLPYSDAEAEEIGLDELMAIALEHNLGLQGEHYSIEKSHYSVDQTYFAFDPSVSGSLSYTHSTAGAGAATRTVGVGASYIVPREYGDSFKLDYSAARVGGGVAGAGDPYSASLGLSYSRPLGRGAGRFINLIPRFVASNNLELSYSRLDNQVRILKKSVMDSYFGALSAREAISVREAGLDVALKQLERSVERYKAGLGIQADVLQSENAVLTQKSSLLSARKQYEGALDVLTQLTGLPQSYKLKPGGQELLEGYGAALPQDLWVLVEQNSFELMSLQTQLANLRLAREQAQNQLKSNTALGLSVGTSESASGLGGAVLPGDNQTYGVNLSWIAKPGERSAKATAASAELDLASLDLQIQQAELDLQTSLRDKQRTLEERAQQVELAQSNLGVVSQAYDISVERNSVGLETTLNVVEAQERVLAAELALLQAKVAYHQAYRELLLLAGII